MTAAASRPAVQRGQLALSLAVLAGGAALGLGATQIPGDAGYGGVGPAFLPGLVSGLLVLCGVALLREATSGGFRAFEGADGATQGDWAAFAWVTAGILANAALITTLGFILSCALLFVLAAQGFRSAEGARGRGLRGVLTDAAIGIAIAAPVYCMFTQALAINLPGLTQTGWL